MRRLLCGLLWFFVLMPSSAQETPSITPTATVRRLLVWWPDALLSTAPEAMAIRDQLTNAFMLNEPGTEVQFRLKSATDDPGGLLPTLRSGSLVAPGVLPDVTLLRRRDLLLAQRDGLIEWLGDAPPTPDLAATITLGYVDDQLYGLPYLIDVQHGVWRGDAVPSVFLDFEDVFEGEVALIFPAGRSTPINEIFYLQYVTAFGEGRAEGIQQQALTTALDYYARLRSAGLISDTLLGYTSIDNYLVDFESGFINGVVVRSSYYLQQRSRDDTLSPFSIPTANGEPATVLDGWVWALVTSNPEQRTLALNYINWMMTPDNQAAIARAAYHIPASATARRQALTDDSYASFIEALLENVVIVPTDSNDASLRALQSAYMSVLTGEKTVEQAVEDALAAISPSS